MRIPLLVIAVLLGIISHAEAEPDLAKAAQAYGKANPVVRAQPNGLIVAEAEEFDVRSPGWQAKNFGENYYAATFANSFLSRRAFLGAPAEGPKTEAVRKIHVPKAGRYLVLVRYEAAYRFETRFRVVVTQKGKTVLDRLYGSRDNLKIWAFRQKLKKEVGWSWGAVENIVWEGHDAFASLQPGEATITLVADKQPGDVAKRNVDLVMLTTDVEQVKNRIDKENYLPLDGMLTQSGDVFVRVTNMSDKPLSFQGVGGHAGGNWWEHSPYWVHMRNWPKVKIDVEPGKTSDWVEVGGTMDSLAHGKWSWTADGKYKAEFGVPTPAGKIEPIANFTTSGTLALAASAGTRYSRELRTTDSVLYDLLGKLEREPTHGKTPTLTPIYATTFPASNDPRHARAVEKFQKLYALSPTKPDASNGRGYIDVRGVPTPKLADYCQKLGANAKNVAVVSLGDEISLPRPSGAAAKEGLHTWLQAQGLKPSDVVVTAKSWDAIAYNPNPDQKKTNPGLFYWSRRYLFHFGIQAIKVRTDLLRKHLPNAHIGANFSPHYPTDHMFLGEVFKWVNVFREDGMTMPWSEDYIWQVAVGTPQMNNINLDLFRAGLRHKPDRKIHYYVMPHCPNNTPRMWKRLFYGALGHGAKIINLFEFRPVHVAYTENHVDDPRMYSMVLRSFRELGKFEDIVQTARVRPAQTTLWFSETGDVWGDSHGSFAPAKRALYTAIRHGQTPLDFVVEKDALDGTLAKYKVLYLTDAHVSRAASKKIAEWVHAGGSLFATAGAGMFDEYDKPNTELRKLLGVEQTALDIPEGKQITYIKQDLPFAEPIETVRWNYGMQEVSIPIFAVRSRVKADPKHIIGAFGDGSPAVVQRAVGKGRTIYCAFLPSLSYYKPAIPRRPVDRGATEDAMIHFLPTEFDRRAAGLIDRPTTTSSKPIDCSEPLVETTILDSPKGIVIPLVNWKREPIERLEVRLRMKLPAKIELASGKAVVVKRDKDGATLTFALDAADALILRE